MKIDKNTTLKIARLARIKINNNEIADYSKQLSNIIDWVQQLNEVNTDQIEPLKKIVEIPATFKGDEPELKDYSQDILENAPEKIENYFVVPKVVE
ncbi:MAG: Glutamyl-tRNA(Gln) amidotransferase subunit C [Alphaproteobacteria bacterium MarineAlpha5_Bin11]|nr:Asp-tRNA(Asn)/Glu-tRNA(Gln) amidotransferase GatCAB subunit C [Pelagibacteraceae bacterium]PPR42885.1 MAG: Glutamyl-tRNA(Gln) amidotransferase subunit C [Alphaproteobacteria bacterium MarineAlpha5_Bin11]|tara:strand:- start:92 stop:379 length:288 start_codon:yes stop_codon:yes gene_type:complete